MGFMSLYELRIVLAHDSAVFGGGSTVQGGDQLSQPWRHDDEIASRAVGFKVGMSDPSRDKDGRAGLGMHRSVAKSEC